MSAIPRREADGPALNLMKGIVRRIDALSKWTGYLIAPIALIYMLIIVYEVVMRYVFNRPTNWAHELSTFLFGAQFMLGGAYCLWRGSMVNMEMVHQRFPFRARSVIDAVLLMLPMLIAGMMLWIGGHYFLSSLAKLEHTNTVWAPPLYPVKGVIPLAALLLLLQVFAQFIRRVYAIVTGYPLELGPEGSSASPAVGVPE